MVCVPAPVLAINLILRNLPQWRNRSSDRTVLTLKSIVN